MCQLYEAGFVEAFDRYSSLKREDNVIYWQGLGWSSEDARVLTAALAHVAQHCSFGDGGVTIDLTSNDFEEEDEELMQRVLGECERVSLWL